VTRNAATKEGAAACKRFRELRPNDCAIRCDDYCVGALIAEDVAELGEDSYWDENFNVRKD